MERYYLVSEGLERIEIDYGEVERRMNNPPRKGRPKLTQVEDSIMPCVSLEYGTVFQYLMIVEYELSYV